MIEKIRPIFGTDSKLGEIPRFWLQYVEPRIRRDGMCWLWDGAHDSAGEPVISLVNGETGKRNTRMLKRIVAAMFYVLKKHYDVFHECGNLSCLNPGHLKVSASHWTQESRETMVKTKRRSIRDYENRKAP